MGFHGLESRTAHPACPPSLGFQCLENYWPQEGAEDAKIPDMKKPPSRLIETGA